MNQVIKKRIEEINSGRVPEGYKQTPFGIFPCDWETDKTYGDLFEFYGSLSNSREELGEEGYAYLHYGDMHRYSFNKVSYDQYSTLPKIDIALKGKEKFLMQDGDVVFLDASEDLEGTSRCVLIDNPNNEPFFAGLHTIPAHEKGNDFSKWFKQYITLPVCVKKQFQRLASGFKVYGLNKDTICQIKYAFPKEKTEQGKIAEILMKWDEMVELQEQYITKLELRKKAVMKKLLTPKDGWESVKLGSIAEMYAGGTPSTKNSKYWGGEIPWIQSGLIQNNYIELKDIEGRITEKGLLNSATSWIKQGSVLVAITGSTCANIAYLKCDATANQSVISITTEKVESLFLFFYLQGVRQQLLALQNGSAQGGLTLKYLENFDVCLPAKIEQKNISNILLITDEEISLQKEKLDKIKAQRKILQQYLLTGIVRVK